MPRPPAKRPPSKPDRDGPVWIYGRHAVAAVLTNRTRHQHKLLATKNALDWLKEHGLEIGIEPVTPKLLDDSLPAGAVHQGLAVKVAPLPDYKLDDVCDPAKPGPVVILDQVTDPQNIGAIFRAAAAFGAQAIIAQDRRTPPLSGALAKAAVGAVETVPFVSVVNISRSLTRLQEIGFHTAGLAGEGATSLPEFKSDRPVALVLGAEGKGLRELVRETCETLVSIPIAPDVESLNVASAASISLYALTRG
ncbi:23S rRNA (guanosine(2251)-2'-O)-methyltransferase RlmB [Parvularcula marina]|uniref:23S rRNA (guanosine(2251)-2'-O)-methyltransferase RlmB n=1 Tax=Parvularcula marina TaxID=2292771 RepID=UPI0035126681